MDSKPRVRELLRVLDRAFGDSQHSLLQNLSTVTQDEWEALPTGAARPIRDITWHVGLFKFMYANHGFRDASMDYDDPPATPPSERLATVDAAIEWLHEAHKYLRDAIVELTDDTELNHPRKAHWGAMVPTLFLIDTMIEHDLYHAGEINRTRGMLQGNDNWFVPPA